MNIVDLPIAFLAQTLKFLNTKDNVSFIKAIEHLSIGNIDSSECFKYLINQKKVYLSNLYCLRSNQLNEYLNYFDPNIVTSINLNYCKYLKWPKVKTILFKLRNLNELFLIKIELTYADLSLIIKHIPNLTKFAFTIPIDGFIRYQHQFSCENLKDLQIDLQKNSQNEIFLNIAKVFPNIQRLTVLNTQKIGSLLKLDLQLFPCLNELFIFSQEIYLDSPKSILKFKKFFINIHVKTIDFNLPKDLDFIAINKSKYFNLNLNDDYHLENLKVIKFGSRRLINSIEINRLKNIIDLDLSQVHIHLANSFCDAVGCLQNVKILQIPCCALKIFALDGTKSSPKAGQNELNFIIRKKIALKKFTLNGLKTDKQNPCDCNQVYFTELSELSKLTLDQVSLTNLDIHCTKHIDYNMSFERAFSFIKSGKISHLNIENITYSEFAWRRGFLNLIKKNQILTHVTFKGLQIDKPLIDSLSTIDTLKYIYIELNKKIPDDICFNCFVNLKQLRFFVMRGLLSNRDVKNYCKKIKM